MPAKAESGEPVSLELAKAHCRIETTADDTLIEQVYIPAARQTVEEYTGRRILSEPVVDIVLDSLASPYVIALDLTPAYDLASIIAIDDDGLRTSIDLVEYGARIVSTVLTSFVTTTKALPSPSAFEVAYSAGYAPGTCPPNLILAMLEFVGDAYENREAQQSQATLTNNPRAVALMDPFRLTFGV